MAIEISGESVGDFHQATGEGLHDVLPSQTSGLDLPTQASVMGAQERHMHSIVPVRQNGKLVSYKVVSPSGKQEFEVSPGDMEMRLLHDTIISAKTDQEEVLGVFDLAYRVKSAMKAIGVTEADLPTDPIDLADKAKLLIIKAAEIQEAKTNLEMHNAAQAFLRLYTRVMTGDKKNYDRLNPSQKELINTFGQAMVLEILARMHVGQEIVNTAQYVKNADLLLRERNATALLMAWHNGGAAAGGALGGFFGGLLGKGAENAIAPVTKAVFGEQKAQKGLIGAVHDTASNIASRATDGVIDKTGQTIDRMVKYVGKGKNRSNQG